MNEMPILLKSLKRLPVPHAPVWMMRQAGRYLSEYRALKEKYSFLEMCRSVELATEVTLQPIRIINPDAAIVFADILLPLEAMGIEIDFAPGPIIKNPITSSTDITSLKTQDVSKTNGYVFEIVKEVKRNLCLETQSPRKAVLGFAGAPWTLACYLIAQGPHKHYLGTNVYAREHKKSFHLLMDKLTTLIEDYLIGQVEAGADAVQLFDTWGGNLGAKDYEELSLPYVQRIVQTIQSRGCPLVFYVNGSNHLLPQMLASGADCLSIDWRTDLKEAIKQYGERVCFQGNLDPTLLYGSKDEIRARTKEMLSAVETQTGYIANLGHGILSTTPREHAKYFIDVVHEGFLANA